MRMRCFLLRGLLYLGAVGQQSLQAQVLAGQVVDKETRAPIPNIPVELRDSANVVAAGRTFDNGTFSLIAPRPGTFQLRIGAAGPNQAVVDSMRLGPDSFEQRIFAIAIEAVYFGFQVDTAARPIPGTGMMLRYPLELRNRGVQGEVLAQFVVDSAGRVVVPTFKVLRTTHEDFTKAAREALSSLRYYPAVREGRRVA